MTIRRMEQVAILVEDLAVATSFFPELGLSRIGTARAVGRRAGR